MPTVPTYQRTETLRPAFRQDVEVRATPGAAGAAIGQGMQRVGAAVGQAAEYFNVIEEARAKDADNALANWSIERMHGKNGYLNAEGVNAVDTYAALTADLEAKRRELGAGLNGGAAQMFERASQARLLSLTQQAMIHRGQEEKKWIVGTSKARADVFHNSAVANWNMPGERAKNIEAGKLEIGTLADKLGWGKDQRDLANLEFTTGVHTGVALEYAKTDYRAADQYLKAHSAAIDPDKMAAIRNQLEPDRINAEADTAFSSLMAAGRTFTPAAPGSAPAKATASSSAMVRNFLRDRLVDGKAASNVDALDNDFATSLAAMMQDAPAEIRKVLRIGSGKREQDEQQILWRRALAKYGSAAAARKWVAPPGKSRHEHGDAVDLQYGSDAARQWVHSNAGKYGLRFPLGNEPWHIEAGTARSGAVRVAANGVGASPRASMPDAETAWALAEKIADPKVREAVWNKYRGYMAVQSAADEQRRKGAQDEYWSHILQGKSPDQIPMDLRRSVGMSVESSAWSYFRQRSEGTEITTNESVFNSLVQEAQVAPEVFAARSIGELAPHLSKSDLRTINAMQGKVRGEKNGTDVPSLIKFGRSEAKGRLESLGITTVGKSGEARAKEAKRVLDFENTLYRQILLASGDKNKPLTKEDVLGMVDSLTADRVFTKERDFWFDSEVSKPTFEIDYADIPATDRKMIEDRFTRQFPGKKPSATQVEDLYQQYLMSRN